VLTVLLYCICCTAALAYTLAAVSPGLMVAMPLLCFILIISLILCGFMIRAPAVPVYWCVLICVGVFKSTDVTNDVTVLEA
jgi:hypothetical protein